MTDLIEQHRAKATEIFNDEQFRTVEDAGKRADQLTVALRHILCCWLLTEATEEDVIRLAGSKGSAYPADWEYVWANRGQHETP